MNRPVFINDHREGVYAAARDSRRLAEREVEYALLKEALADLIEAGGAALHVLFVSGGEPTWRHPSERERLVELSDALHAAFSKMSETAL